MRRAVGGVIPGVAIAVLDFGAGHAFGRDKVFQRCQPMPVVRLAAVGVACRLRSLDFARQCGRPFVPRKQSAGVERERHGKRLRFPRFMKDGSISVLGNAGQGASRLDCCFRIERHQMRSR